MKYDKYYIPDVDLGITITKEQALKAQARDFERHKEYKWLKARVADMTSAHLLEDGKEYDIKTINKHIPRGVNIDKLVDEAKT
jgi:hypothetical protein